MAIPSISRANVLSALGRIDREGMPASRQSARYVLEHGGNAYAPKYAVSLAVEAATGHGLDPGDFGGGHEANSLLQQLGFDVRDTRAADNPTTPEVEQKDGPAKQQAPRAGERAPLDPDSTVRESSNRRPRAAVRRASSLKNQISTPLIARVVVRGQPGNATEAERMLLEVLETKWTPGLHVKFLLTPGGFVTADCTRKRTGVSWESTAADIEELRPFAMKALHETVTARVREAAKGKVDVLTVGVDLDDGKQVCAELVAACDLSSGRDPLWTGKSYPTSKQERYLLQVRDLETHFMRLAGERVLVLGCHDLNMFSQRVLKRPDTHISQVRKERASEMLRRTRQFAPTIVLQHPHSTDNTRTWAAAWGGVRGEFPDLKSWASGIACHDGDGGKPRQGVRRVLPRTADMATVRDFIVVPTSRSRNG